MPKIIKKVQSREIELRDEMSVSLFKLESYDVSLQEMLGTRGLLETLLVPRPERKHNALLMAGTYTLKVGDFREIVRTFDDD